MALPSPTIKPATGSQEISSPASPKAVFRPARSGLEPPAAALTFFLTGILKAFISIQPLRQKKFRFFWKSISYFAQALRNETDSRYLNGAEKFLSLISESASHAKEAISDIIWSIDPANDDWEKISAKLRRYASDLFESKAIRYQIDLPGAFPLDKMKMERRRNFWLVFKEMVTNAARHSQCTEIKIQLSASSKLFHLIIQDNGQGFDSEVAAAGNGIRNIRVRAQNLNAYLDLQTSPQSGTRWQMTFQI